MTQRKTLFQLTWPTYIEFSFLMFMMVADTLMLSQYSDASVAAVGNANRIIFLLTVLINIVAIGVGVVVSQYVGASRDEDSHKALQSGLIGGVIIASILLVFLQLFAPQLLSLVNTPFAIVDDALIYLRIVGVGLIFVALSQTTGSGFRALGFPKRVMIAGASANVLNIILNFFLIFGLWGAPELGVQGAAIATLVARIFTAALLLTSLFYERIISFKVSLKRLRKYLKEVIHIGFPSALEQFIYQVSEFLILIMVNTLGTIAVTTQIYVFNLSLPVLVFAIALAQGNQVIVGWHIGAIEDDPAYKRTVRTMIIGMVTVLVLTVIVYVNAQHILRIFTDNQTIIDTGKRILFVFIFLEIGRLSNIVVIQALRATGDVKYPVYAALISMLLIKIPLAYLLVFVLDMGLIGIFIAIAADENIRGVLVFLRWLKKPWLKKERLISNTSSTT